LLATPHASVTPDVLRTSMRSSLAKRQDGQSAVAQSRCEWHDVSRKPTPSSFFLLKITGWGRIPHSDSAQLGDEVSLTRGKEFLQVIEDALTALRHLGYGPYARHDVAGILDPLGSRLETFLRATVLPTSSRKHTLKDLIAALVPAGLPQSQADVLDCLRSLYNRSKHKPSEELPLGHAIDAVQRAAAAVSEIVALGLGTVQVPYERELNYHLYVAFWDHYSGGETEVAVSLPGDHWTHVALVDTLNMDIKSWDRLKPMLTSHPQFRLGKENFPPEMWKSFTEEGDFLNAGIWDGDYGELIRLLAAFDDRSVAARLIPGLGRAHNPTSVAIALIVAAVDVVRAAAAPLTSDELAEAIGAGANNEYAIPRSGPAVRPAAAQIAALINTVPFPRWRYLVGPVLVRAQNEPSPETLSGPLHIEMDGNAIVLGFR
jgi:hypothetical protein